MQLVVITRHNFFDGEAAVLNCLFEAELPILHLRKPQASAHAIRALLRKVDAGFHRRIIVHGHAALRGEFDLLGVHLPLGLLLEQGKRADVGQVSCSTHTGAEASAAAQVADRAFVSPVFDSISKRGYLGNALLLDIPKPMGKLALVALGGITPERLLTVHQHGFKAAALMGYIWEDGRPLKSFSTCQAVATHLNNTI
ncbi:thiamine phosphate synthase [Parapedobacter sp. DT-150]|uniref:thiamine phosphate synthase n=1 Tax=Parapedobacter sp. DT-150 TaxID=3396162 RepID=UPI003F1A6B3D